MTAVGIISPARREVFERDILALVFQVVTAPEALDRLGPLRKRERFKDRQPLSCGRKEFPLEFIERVYPDRREYDLCRSDLMTIDKKLYDSLNAWLQMKGERIPEEFGLPSLSEYVDRQIEAFGFTGDSPRKTATPQARAVLNAYGAARARLQRNR